jgi:hypothetical protein
VQSVVPDVKRRFVFVVIVFFLIVIIIFAVGFLVLVFVLAGLFACVVAIEAFICKLFFDDYFIFEVFDLPGTFIEGSFVNGIGVDHEALAHDGLKIGAAEIE